MKSVDFLFVYENKQRELENVCLLKYELEKRGYSVAICETWRKIHYNYWRYNAKVIITFAMYGDGQAEYMGTFSKKVQKIVNLQWEQLFTVADEESNSGIYVIKGKAKRAVHISWGNFNYERLINQCGMVPPNVCKAGHIAGDFLKPLFDGYYLKREEILSKYDIDNTRKVVLFISTFSYVDMADEVLQSSIYKERAISTLDFKQISIKSQKNILNWFEHAMRENNDITIVYRPHPAEVGNERLTKMQEKYLNFKVIRDYSVKQWIYIADKIYNWFSTSMMEIYAAGKNCGILRPIEIPREFDVRYFVGCNAIKTLDAFLADIKTNDNEAFDEKRFPIDVDMLRRYYRIDEGYAYKRICDKCEEVYRDDKYRYDFYHEDSRGGIRFYNYIKESVIKIIVRTLAKGYIRNNPVVLYLYNRNEKNRKLIDDYVYIEKMIINYYASQKEIKMIQNKIESVIVKNDL